MRKTNMVGQESGTIDEFIDAVETRIHELSTDPINSATKIEDYRYEDICEWLSNYPEAYERCADYCGVNDLLSEAREDDVMNWIDDHMYDQFVQVFASNTTEVDEDLETIYGGDSDIDQTRVMLANIDEAIIEDMQYEVDKMYEELDAIGRYIMILNDIQVDEDDADRCDNLVSDLYDVRRRLKEVHNNFSKLNI